MREVPRKPRLDVRQTTIDRVVAWFDPVRGMQRMRARTAMALAGGHAAASKSKRSLANWKTQSSSADGAVLPDLPQLRERSRDLVRDAPLAGGAINTVVTRVVGTGLALQPRPSRELLGLNDDQAERWQRLVLAEWQAWAETTACDATRMTDFYGLQGLALRSALESGDVFALLPDIETPRSPYELAVQLVEGDRICNPQHLRDTPTLAGGVRKDTHGAAVGYYILQAHPGDSYRLSRQWDFVPVFGAASGRRNALHVMERRRPDQSRGLPYLTPVIEAMKQLARYTEAEIDAAVISSFFTVFFEGATGEGPDVLTSAATGEAPAGNDAKQAWDGTLSSGLMVDLDPGVKPHFANPTRPNTAFDPFVMAVLRQIGIALELPFEVLVKHFQSSYSAARAALLDAWNFFRVRRAWMAAQFCQPVYEEWLTEAVARGRIHAPGFFADPLVRFAWCRAEWVGDGPGSIDPLKEANAVEKRLALNLTTLETETMLHDGSHWADNVAQRKREIEALDAAGLAAPAASASAIERAPLREDEDEANEH